MGTVNFTAEEQAEIIMALLGTIYDCKKRIAEGFDCYPTVAERDFWRNFYTVKLQTARSAQLKAGG